MLWHRKHLLWFVMPHPWQVPSTGLGNFWRGLRIPWRYSGITKLSLLCQTLADRLVSMNLLTFHLSACLPYLYLSMDVCFSAHLRPTCQLACLPLPALFATITLFLSVSSKLILQKTYFFVFCSNNSYCPTLPPPRCECTTDWLQLLWPLSLFGSLSGKTT